MKKLVTSLFLCLCFVMFFSSCSCDCMEDLNKTYKQTVAIKKELMQTYMEDNPRSRFNVYVNNEWIGSADKVNITIDGDFIYFGKDIFQNLYNLSGIKNDTKHPGFACYFNTGF